MFKRYFSMFFEIINIFTIHLSSDKRYLDGRSLKKFSHILINLPLPAGGEGGG